MRYSSLARRRDQINVSLLPPVELRYTLLNARLREPILIAKGHKIVDIPMSCFDLHDSRMVHVIVMVMRYDDGVNVGDILDLTGHVCITLGTKPREWAKKN